MDCGVLIDDFNQSFQQQMPQMIMVSFPPTALDRPLSVDLSYIVGTIVEKQRQEMDQYLQKQINQLRMAIQQQSKQHLTYMWRNIESKVLSIFRQKDEELAMANKRILELEACLERIEANKEAWERVARENEALAMSFNNVLEQLQNPCFSSTGGLEEEEKETASSSEFPVARKEPTTKIGRSCCKACGFRDSCILFLPCRHICSCKLCKTFLEVCPICRSVKQDSVEVFFV